jgi:hypothetical protein
LPLSFLLSKKIFKAFVSGDSNVNTDTNTEIRLWKALNGEKKMLRRGLPHRFTGKNMESSVFKSLFAILDRFKRSYIGDSVERI